MTYQEAVAIARTMLKDKATPAQVCEHLACLGSEHDCMMVLISTGLPF